MKSTFFVSCLSPLAILFLAPYVDAHGYLTSFSVDGTSYAGNVPGASTNPSPIRQISTIDPVKGASNTNLMCGQNAQNAAMVVDANPGSTISFQWGDVDTNWPHNTGPVMTYMASCGSTTCDQFDPTNAKWFKIDEAGKQPNDSSTWIQQDIMNQQPYSTKIPSTLAPGEYLIRNEIIALHLAVTLGGAEFYPTCVQVKVGGSQTAVASSSELVSFPGAYSDTDPGIYDPNVYDPSATYVFPGPPVAQMAVSNTGSSSGSSPSGSSSASVPSNTSNANPSGSTPSPSPTATGQCSLMKRTLAKRSNVDNVKLARPRHISRVMKNLLHGDSWRL